MKNCVKKIRDILEAQGRILFNFLTESSFKIELSCEVLNSLGFTVCNR